MLFFPNDAEYITTIQSYYGGDSWDLRPQCILKPNSTSHVSMAIKALNSEKAGRCWFVAIRGGGHSNFPASNTNSGVTIDLVRLSTLDLEIDESVSIGSGNRWGKVYQYLEPRGLMVAGGREGTVGVAGLLLGGGFSWYSGNVGFAADNVIEYEVVLANSSIITATASRNADLFKALKGGATNFGVVTKFKLRTFPARNLYGGIMVFPYTQSNGVLQKFTQMIESNTKDYSADTGFIAAAWSPSGGKRISYILANIEGHSNTSAFEGLSEMSPVVDLRSNLTVTGIGAQIASTTGEYQVWNTLTYHNTLSMGQKILASFEAVVADIEDQIDASENVRIIYLMTPFPVLYSSHGNNVLGLQNTHTTNSVVFSLQATLPNAKYRDLLRTKLSAATADIEAYAKETGQNMPYRYLNYAGPDQNPIATYGKESVLFMKDVAAKYDPEEFFQYVVPGGFKLKDV
ncbi:FAD binding domain-containing protein [Colletotrichum truncatum]|uniref:FAD binding domain-containing protein n=1 Tax=Colletotrichum truncatum TaxID=5467 RepID=A0ACC3YI91_COLTU